jgi:hypothetical protein
MKSAIVGLALISLCLTGAAASGAPITVALTTADGRGADSFVRGGGGIDPVSGLQFRNTNYGDSELAAVKFIRSGIGASGPTIDYNNSFTRDAFLRFDLAGINGTVTAATLTLGVRATENAQAETIAFNIIVDGHAQDAAPGAGGWEESTLTMNNSGLVNAAVPLLQAISGGSVTVPGTAVPNLVTTVQWSHANLVALLNADTNGLVTFVIEGSPSSSPLGVNFWTKENIAGGFIPTLELTYEAIATVAEPTGIALFGFGLAGLGAAMRRRRQDPA